MSKMFLAYFLTSVLFSPMTFADEEIDGSEDGSPPVSANSEAGNLEASSAIHGEAPSADPDGDLSSFELDE